MKLFAYTTNGTKNYLNLDHVVAYEIDKYGNVKVYLPSHNYIWLTGMDAERLLKEIQPPKGGKK